MSLSLGYMCEYWGLANAAYALALIVAIASLWPLCLALRGELGPPPADLQTLANEAKEVKGTGSSTASLKKPSGGERKPQLPYLSLYQISFHILAVGVPAYGNKMLLTSIFQDAYSASFLTSANMATVSLVLFALTRSLFVFVAKPGFVMSMLIALMSVNAILYGCYPIIIERFLGSRRTADPLRSGGCWRPGDFWGVLGIFRHLSGSFGILRVRSGAPFRACWLSEGPRWPERHQM